jgi:murein DD-endopeptidase MepM/ murein hydrolase activator NlpD
MAENLIIGIQRDLFKNSLFVEITPAKRFFIRSALVFIALGLVGLFFSLFLWSYQIYTFHYYQDENSSLKNELILETEKQKKLAEELNAITKEEKSLRLSYGLQDDHVFHQFAKGGSQTADELFINMADPLQQQYSALVHMRDYLKHNINLTLKHFKELQSYIKYKSDLWAHTPVVSPSNGRMTSGFGDRIHPVTGLKRFHFGLDIAGSKWTEIYATADGQVNSTNYSKSLGKVISVDHENGYATKYAHLEKIMVEDGQLVKRYDLIGYMGQSGISTGTHLHYEVLRDNIAHNPKNFILPDEIMVD